MALFSASCCGEDGLGVAANFSGVLLLLFLEDDFGVSIFFVVANFGVLTSTADSGVAIFLGED